MNDPMWSSANPNSTAGPGPHRHPVAVCGVFSPIALRNPLTYLRHREEDRWWLASNLQMLVPALRNVTTRVTFGVAFRTADAGGAVSQRVLAEMRRLIEGR